MLLTQYLPKFLDANLGALIIWIKQNLFWTKNLFDQNFLDSKFFKFLRLVMGLGHLEPHSQMPNSFHNDFGKFRRLRRVQLLRKHFIKKN